MIKFTKKEIEFLQNNEACRMATSHDNIPHVVPVTYYFEDDLFYLATDYDTKKHSNLQQNNKIAITVDIYTSGKHKAVIVQGITEFIEKGSEYKRLYEIFYKKFSWVRDNPWKEGEAPFVKIKPKTKTSWGLN
ncbi:MAG TPA: pyridoxamine 5'-phosphate oxidase family protein [Nitrosopumilaceae archaeon]|nr:pyridoxamine 5'-phosphate oxidase family protein [Nitrosopumilaceae archaeon]